MDLLLVDKIILNALEEDINYYDITTDNLIPADQVSKAVIRAKGHGVLAGVPVAERVFMLLDSSIKWSSNYMDGDSFNKGDIIAQITGSTRSILKGERTALNVLQRLCGIAAKTREYVDMVKEYNVKLADTRKTTPGLRALEKYAVRMGGGHNHRFNLSDGVLIKDNHIEAVGGIENAIGICREKIGHTVKIEVEVETLEQLKAALRAGADIVMLDNMDLGTIKKAVEIIDGRAVTEVSGNIDAGNLKEVAETGVDVISIGALTHTVVPVDLSMDFI